MRTVKHTIANSRFVGFEDTSDVMWNMASMVQDDFSSDVTLDIVDDSDDTPSHSGCKSLKVSATADGSLGYMLAQSLSDVQVGTQYQISYWVRLDAETTTCTITTAFTNPAPDFPSNDVVATAGENGNDWFQISYTGEVQSLSDDALNVFFADCDGPVYVDDFDVQVGAASLPTIVNNRFYPLADMSVWAVTPSDTSATFGDSNDGAANAYAYVLFDPSSTPGTVPITLSQEITDWDATEAYTVSVWLRVDEEDDQCTAQMYVDDLVGDGPVDADNDPVPLSTDWSLVYYTLDPTGTTDVQLGLRFDGCTQDIFVDDFEMVTGFAET